MASDGFWDFLKQEAKVVLRTATPIIISLYVKRSVDKLIGPHGVNERLVRAGVPGMPTTGVPVTVAATCGLTVFREGPGSIWVAGHGRVYFRSHYRTADGFDLYNHSDDMHPRHEVACPLLITDRGCEDCRFNVEPSGVKAVWESNCSAAVWLSECASQEIGLEHFRDMM